MIPMDLHYTLEQRSELLAMVARPNGRPNGGWDALIEHLQTLAPDFELYAVSTEWAYCQAAPYVPLKARGVLGDVLIHFEAEAELRPTVLVYDEVHRLFDESDNPAANRAVTR